MTLPITLSQKQLQVMLQLGAGKHAVGIGPAVYSLGNSSTCTKRTLESLGQKGLARERSDGTWVATSAGIELFSIHLH